jgi:hypothetical protein
VTFHDGFRQSPPSACICLPGRAYDFRTPQRPFNVSKTSTLESLGIDELMMLDNFYLSNVTAVFFVQCPADLEREMVRSAVID